MKPDKIRHVYRRRVKRNHEEMETKKKEGWGMKREVQKSVGWSINTAGIIKSPCSAFCSPSLVTEHRKRLTTELCIAKRVCVCVCVCVCVYPWPLITSLRDPVRPRLSPVPSCIPLTSYRLLVCSSTRAER